jgi:hypothetical protein
MNVTIYPGRYSYVMAILIDVTREVDAYVSKTKLASDLMDMLPDLTIHGDD